LHSTAAAHAAPIGFFPQLAAAQLLGALQSAEDVQVVRQAAVGPQT
jgi:hypothetical protein